MEAERKREEAARAARKQKKDQKKAKPSKKPKKAKEAKKKEVIFILFPSMIDFTKFRRNLKIMFFFVWILPENVRQKYFLDVLTHPNFVFYCLFSFIS